MSRARLLSVTIERFKSFEAATELRLGHLTIIVGRNNSGKSSLIQSLLLLKQTLGDPRFDIALKLEGLVHASNLRELTFGWPPSAPFTAGPTLTVEWRSTVDINDARNKALSPEMGDIAKNSKVAWLREAKDEEILRTKITLETAEVNGDIRVVTVKLWSARDSSSAQSPTEFHGLPLLEVKNDNGAWNSYWRGELADKLTVEMRHFVPFLLIDRRNIGPRHGQRGWHNAYTMLFAQPLADLSTLLSEFHYLGSSRLPPQILYPTASAPNDIGASGENAAVILHRRQSDIVHFLPPLLVTNGKVTIPPKVHTRSMGEAVNEVMASLSIDAKVKTRIVQDLGFQLMFGDATVLHVGRGLNSLLPMVGLGLFADPLRFAGQNGDMLLDEYLANCTTISNIALEEPEAHLHPKVASLLAHWLVSLAMSNRQIIVETHSDHLVRRLRRMAVSAGKGSALERWLLDHVTLAMVEQKQGRSTLTTSHLTSEGGLAEKWPADFMDEATDEESAIYYAKMEKTEPAAVPLKVKFEEGDEPEPQRQP